MGKTTNKIVVIASLAVLVAFIFAPIHYRNNHLVDACHVHCWIVQPGEIYPAQFTTTTAEDEGQKIINLDCKILTKNVNGHIGADCTEK